MIDEIATAIVSANENDHDGGRDRLDIVGRGQTSMAILTHRVGDIGNAKERTVTLAVTGMEGTETGIAIAVDTIVASGAMHPVVTEMALMIAEEVTVEEAAAKEMSSQPTDATGGALHRATTNLASRRLISPTLSPSWNAVVA